MLSDISSKFDVSYKGKSVFFACIIDEENSVSEPIDSLSHPILGGISEPQMDRLFKLVGKFHAL